MQTREEYVNAVREIAESFTQPGAYSWERYIEMCNICFAWNRNHSGDEIFMMDDVEDCEGHTGFAVEDDIFPVADWND